MRQFPEQSVNVKIERFSRTSSDSGNNVAIAQKWGMLRGQFIASGSLDMLEPSRNVRVSPTMGETLLERRLERKTLVEL